MSFAACKGDFELVKLPHIHFNAEAGDGPLQAASGGYLEMLKCFSKTMIAGES
jgi:hypothetical protein